MDKVRAEMASLPSDWVCSGSLPECDPEVLFEHDELALDEDVFAIQAGGKYFLDVGWYPAYSPGGKFRCVLVKEANWERPLHVLETRSAEAVRNWVSEQVGHVQRLTVL